MGRSSGLAYLENKTRCPYDSRNQVKHIEHQAVEKLRCGDEQGVIKKFLFFGHPQPSPQLTVLTVLTTVLTVITMLSSRINLSLSHVLSQGSRTVSL